MKALIEPCPFGDILSTREGNPNQNISYQIGKTTFIVTPIYQTARGESLAAILLRLMKADVERV